MIWIGGNQSKMFIASGYMLELWLIYLIPRKDPSIRMLFHNRCIEYYDFLKPKFSYANSLSF
jgi:hypothetical protein